MKKKIAVFSLAYAPLIGGAEIAVAEIAKRLPAYQFDIYTKSFSADHLKEEDFGNVRVIRINGSKISYPFRAALLAARAHARAPYSASWSIMAAYGGIAARFFKFLYPRVPMLLSLQEGDPLEYIEHKVRFIKSLFRSIFTSADWVQTISVFLSDFAKKQGARVPVEVIPNGVDLDNFVFIPHEVPDRGIVRLVTASRLVEKNGVDLIIRALAKLPARFELDIAGGGKLEKELRALASEVGVFSRVRFLGELDHQAIIELFRQSQIFIRPSRSEGLGNSFLEAMATGLPVIGTLVGGIPDFLVDKKTGIAVPPEDPSAIADAVHLLVSDKELYQSISGTGRAVVERRFSWDRVSKLIGVIFETITGGKSRILHAAGIYPPDLGGPAMHAEKLAIGFSKAGFLSRPIALAWYRKYFVGLRHLLYFFALLSASRGRDIVYAHDLVGVGVPARLVAFFGRKKLVVRVGGDLVWERAAAGGTLLPMNEFYEAQLFRGLHFRLSRFVLRSASLVFVPARNLVTLYQKYYGIDPKKIVLVPNPLPNNVVSSVFFEASRPTILFAGRFVAYKNLSRVIEACRDLSKKYRFNLRLIGDGPDLPNLSKHNEPWLQIIPGLSHGELIEDINNASICIAPALTEFAPNFILECAVAEKAVAISSNHGLSKTVIDIPVEAQFNPLSIIEIKNVLKKLLDEPIMPKLNSWSWENVISLQLKKIQEI